MGLGYGFRSCLLPVARFRFRAARIGSERQGPYVVQFWWRSDLLTISIGAARSLLPDIRGRKCTYGRRHDEADHGWQEPIVNEVPMMEIIYACNEANGQ
ncbi:hypothetical protein TZ53_23905 (plasmid) [Sphingobium sp. YBL2]|nr:hypothetical protein TZ53_23905 [Sphingobium sp. YBL2]